MQLLTRVLLLAVTVLGASAWPRMADQTSFMRMVLAQLGAEDSRGLTPAQTVCANQYRNASEKIGMELSNATAKCEDKANHTLADNSHSLNATVNQIRNHQITIQKNIEKCLNETDNQRFINCTESIFDTNLQLLDKSNSMAYNADSEMASNSTVVSQQRLGCISAAIGESKVKTIEAANDYFSCLEKANQQRELPAQQPAQQPDQQAEQKPAQQEREQVQQMQPIEPAQAALPAQPAQPAQPALPF